MGSGKSVVMDTNPYCSVCKEEPIGRKMSKYCPNCGAKMCLEEVEDMKCNQFVCNLCKHSRSACLKHEKNFECFEWRYADKAKGMISDE